MKTLLCVLAVLAMVAPALAQTDVTENVATNTTWGAAGSPYTLQGDIYVTSGSVLTIDPGVIVKFDADARLRTNAGCSIVANGTGGNEILFTSNSGAPAPYDWFAVYLFQSPASSFSYCTFEYGQFNLYISQSDLAVSHCTFRKSMNGITCDSASPQIESCDIVQNMNGIVVYGPVSAPAVHNCNVYDNPAGNMYVTAYLDPYIASLTDELNGIVAIETSAEELLALAHDREAAAAELERFAQDSINSLRDQLEAEARAALDAAKAEAEARAQAALDAAEEEARRAVEAAARDAASNAVDTVRDRLPLPRTR